MKLPAKHTTKHITRHQQPEGAVNAHGEIKQIDNQTGKAKWIDEKKGLSLDLNGNLTHKRF